MVTNAREIELTPEQKQALAEKAEQAGRPWSEIFWDAIRSYRPRRPEHPAESSRESFYDSVRDSVGMVKDAPPDLSANPKHMEGFGREPDNGAD